MKKFLLFFSISLCGALIANSQTVYNVGADKEYQEISAVWTLIKASADAESVINIDEGTYITGALVGLPHKKITLIGAGADKTILKAADVENFKINTEPEFGPDAGYMFQSPKKATPAIGYDEVAIGFELVCEKITFQNAGTANNNWGAGLIMAENEDQKYTFKNCMFKNIYARQGAIIGTTAQNPTPVSFVMEDCFVEECGGYEHNNNSGMIFMRHGGELVLKNTTFMNNTFHMYNIRPNTNGADNNRKAGLYVTVNTGAEYEYGTSVTIENVNIINTKLTAEEASTCPMIRIGSSSEFVGSVKTFDVKNLVSINNTRSGTADCDFSFLTELTPTIESSFFNAVSSVTFLSADTYDFTPLAEYTGATVDASLTYSSPAINFEMDGDLPKVFENEFGVKYLKKSNGQSVENSTSDKLDIITQGGVLSVRNLPLGSIVSVFDCSGKEIKQIVVDSETTNFTLESGIYIVRAEAKVVKVIL